MNARRSALPRLDPRRPPGHAGLVLDRGLEIAWANDDAHRESRHWLCLAARDALVQARPLYTAAFQRWRESLPALRRDSWFKTEGRTIVGLGRESVLETGLELQFPFGVPVLPGTALKGLSAHFAHQHWAAIDPGFAKGGERHRVLFGDTKSSGHVVFHDAWLDPSSLERPELVLADDVLTPHHGGAGGGPSQAPGDFDDPNPVPFLSVHGRFRVAVSWESDDPEGRPWTDLAFDLLGRALLASGIGGKTASGYGRLVAESDAAPAPTVMRYKANDRLFATRVEDPRGRGRVWFQADDGFSGVLNLRPGQSLPDVPLGQVLEVVVAGVNSTGAKSYNFLPAL